MVIRIRDGERSKWLLFLIGMFGLTQFRLGGYIGISEFVMAVFAPVLFFKNLAFFKRDRVLPILWLCLLWTAGAIIADWIAGMPMLYMAKGAAPSLVIFSTVVCMYPLLRKSPNSLKWFVTGVAISGVIIIFAFRTGSSGGADGTVEGVMGYKLFWVNQLSNWLGLPTRGWYLQTPIAFSLIAAMTIAFYSLYVGGRSDFLIAAVSALLMFVGGKTPRKMNWIKNHFVMFLVTLVVGLLVIKSVYVYAASGNLMSEKEKDRIGNQLDAAQEKSKGGVVGILMNGRAEFFIGLFAALDKPIIGHGTIAFDTKGYRRDFIAKYGSEKDIQQMMKSGDAAWMRIPAHSHIISAWLNHGIFGGLFWVYVLWLLFNTLRKRMAVYPPWYGYFCMMLPFSCWAILFSPFGQRPVLVGLIVAALVVRSMEKDASRFSRMQKVW